MATNSNPSDPIKPELDPKELPNSGDEKPQVFAVNREDTKHKFSRRGFLELAGVATAGLVLTGANSSAMAQEGTATPTPTPVPCTISTRKTGVQVHVGPGRNRGVRQYLPANQDFPVIGQAKAGDGSAWWKIEINDIPQAWVAQTDVEASGDCQNVGGAKIPPVVIAATRAPTGVPTPTAMPGKPGTVPPGQTGINYMAGGQTYTMPCGSPIPAGATCVCNCVSVCSCDGMCSCDGASHYWYPN